MKKKSTIYIILAIIILLSIFNFLIVQTDFFQSKLGIHFNSQPVLVATRNLHINEKLSVNDVEVKYVPNNLVLKNPKGDDGKPYVLTDVRQITDGLVISEEILTGEQIPVSRLKPLEDATTSKNLLYQVTIDYDGANGNNLYVGDEAFLWYTLRDKETTITKKFFEDKITIINLKNAEGVDVNTNRDASATIPARAFIRVDDEDIMEINELKNKGAIFFFIKEA